MSLILSGTNGLSEVDGSAATPAIRGTDANTGIFFPAADTIAFSEGGVEAMRIDSSGNVGIGTSSPVSKLHIESASAESFQIGYSSTKRSRIGTTSAGDTQIYAYETGVGYKNVLLAVDAGTSAGNVGIGTSSPAYKLDVAGVGRFVSTNTMFINPSYDTGVTAVQVLSNAALAFATNNTERARIDSSGSLFVGTTTTPSSSNAGIRIGAPGANFWVSYNSGTTAYNQFLFGNANGNVGVIQTSGSSTTYSTSSDYRLKEDIAPMTGALAKVTALKPCIYKWKVDGSDGQGFIAHELQEVIAGCVTGEKDEIDTDGNPVYQGIDTSFLVATLTAALQELKALVDTQASTITALQADVAALKVQP